MKPRTWLALYLVHWYCFAVSGVLLAQQVPDATWLSRLPWTSWGTELADGLTRGDPVTGGALWIALGSLLVALGVTGSLVASLFWLIRGVNVPASARTNHAPASRPSPDSRVASLSRQAQEAADLVEDPQVRRLIQQLNTRLG